MSRAAPVVLLLLGVGGCSRFGFGNGPSEDLWRDGPHPEQRADGPGLDRAEELQKTDRLADLPVDPSVDLRADRTGDRGADLGGPAVSAINDTCANPAPIDLLPLSLGQAITFQVDTTGAKADYFMCFSAPDVVVRFINSPGTEFWWTCSGSGSVQLSEDDPGPGGSCPPSASSSGGGPCSDGSWMAITLPAGVAYVLICRSQSTPVTMHLHHTPY